uniref:G-protein coupled receptors family 1 profile domain-containing protein n=1 Tax=Knipowitschia caucasica TaxID=637954 RepID=A0AAV2JB23_KNICA
MPNSSSSAVAVVFELEGFLVAPASMPFLFLLLLCDFLVALLGNGAVLVAVVMDRRLWQPMFVLMLNLALVDLLGAAAVCPRLLAHMLFTDRSQRYISHAQALLQAFAVHTYGITVQTVLAAMAYDRFCGTLIQHAYCSNRGLLSLSCEPSPANNYYGLAMTYLVSTTVFLITAFSYTRILMAAVWTRLRPGRSGLDAAQTRSKAIQTCCSHLVVYVVYNVASVIIIISYRLPPFAVTPNVKKLFTALFIILPPALNPIIYGLVSRELRAALYRQLRRAVPSRGRRTVPKRH